MQDTELLNEEVETQVDDAQAQPVDDAEQPEVDANADAEAVDTDQVDSDVATEEAAEFDDGLIDRAEQYGLSDNQIMAFNTPEALRASLDMMDMRFAAAAKNSAANHAPANGQASQSQTIATPRQEAPAQANVAPVDFDLETLKESLDEDVYEALQKIQGNANTRVAALEKQLHQVSGTIQQQQQRAAQSAVAQQVDIMIGRFGKEWESTFGTKPTASLKVHVQTDANGQTVVTGSDRDQFIARDKFWREVNALVVGYEMNGVPFPGEDVIGERALRLAFGQEQTKRDRVKLREALNKRVSRSSKKPTHRDIVDPDRQPTDAEIAQALNARVEQGRKIGSGARPSRKNK